jgi:hypothetical protein
VLFLFPFPFPCPFSLSLLLSSFLVSPIIAKNLSSLLLTDLITLSTVPLLRVRVFNCLLPSFPPHSYLSPSFPSRIALRCATALGLNIATDSFVESGVITNEVRLARNSVFHTVFQQDSVRCSLLLVLPFCTDRYLPQLWSLALGRFVTYRNEDHEIPLPTVDSAVDAQPWLVPTIWQHTDPSAENGSSPRHLQPHSNMAGLVSTTFVATAKLALIQSELIKELFVFPSPPLFPANDLY